MMPGKTSGTSQSQDATVYTIYAGMIPTLGFARGDFHISRGGNIGDTAHRSSEISIGTSISPRGRQRKARIRGSVAWYEYSTTVRAIHEEILGGDENNTNKQAEAHTVLRWPRGWKNMFTQGNARLARDFVDDIGVDIIQPQDSNTGESYSGVRGTQSEQEGGGDWGELHKADDEEARAQGRLVNRANSIDMYFRGRDNNIYRIDVTSMNMSASGQMEAHHGLGTLASRTAAGVNSEQLLATLSGGNTDIAEERLLAYFQGRTNEYNQVIKTLKQHLRDTTHHGADFLKNLDLGNQEQLAEIREELEAAFDTHGSSHTNNPNKTDPMSQLRPNLNEALRRVRSNAQLMQGRDVTDKGLKSAVRFALHAIGNVINSKARGSKGTITEYRITAPSAPIPWTIGVMHKIINSGQSVLEFMGLKEGDVRVYNEVALENAFIRANIHTTRQGQDAILNESNIERNFQHAAYLVAQDNTAVQVGDLVTSSIHGICRSATTLRLGAQAVISPREFNDDIDNWIRTVGTGSNWRSRVHPFLERYILQGPEIQQRERMQNERNRFAQIASPINSQTTGPNSLNTFNMLASENTRDEHGNLRDLFALDICSAERGSSGMRALIDEREAALPVSGAFRRGRESWRVAGDLLRGASGMSEHEWEQNMRLITGKGSPNTANLPKNYSGPGFPGADTHEAMRGMGMHQMLGLMRPHRSLGPQQMSGKQRKYWGLQEYLSRDTQSGFDDNVTPSWWAAPYISLEYGSGKLGS